MRIPQCCLCVESGLWSKLLCSPAQQLFPQEHCDQDHQMVAQLLNLAIKTEDVNEEEMPGEKTKSKHWSLNATSCENIKCSHFRPAIEKYCSICSVVSIQAQMNNLRYFSLRESTLNIFSKWFTFNNCLAVELLPSQLHIFNSRNFFFFCRLL